MRNLKRVLSLALASAMLFGMMVMGAAAADKKPLTDLDKVTNKEAVNLMVDLGIIAGKPDGSFAPAETVDRATMSKLIYFIMMGTADESAFKGIDTGLKDVKGNWAEGFINYCYSVKIVAGDGAGSFLPSNKVTVAAAAKMLLVALGYDADASKYQNDTMWSVNIMRDAQSAGLLKGISQKSTEELTRDNAAQMIYNTLFASTVKPDFQIDMGIKYLKGYTPVTADGVVVTLAKSNYNLTKYTGVVVANEFANIFASGAMDAGKTTIYPYITTDSNKGEVTATGAKTIKVSTDVALLGQEVVYYTHGNDNTDSSFIVATGKTKEYTWTDNTIDLAKFKTNSGLSDSSNIKYSTNYTVGNYTPVAKDGSRFIDSNADGKLDFVLKTAYTFSKVTKIDSTNVTISGLGTRKIADVSGSADLKKDDYVNYATVGTSGKAVVAKATEVTGTVSALKDSKAKAVIDGTTYTVAANAGNASPASPAQVAKTYIDSLTLSKAVAGIFYLNQAGEIAVYLPTEETTASTVLYAYVTGIQVTSDFGVRTVQVKAVLADGTQETLTVVDNITTGDDAANSGLYDAATAINDGNYTGLYGVYPYTLNKDSAMVAGAKVATSAYTNGAYTAGKPEMKLDSNVADEEGTKTSILMDANTVVLFYSKSGDKETISSVKGVDNVPGIAKNASVTYVKDDAKTFASFILVEAVGKTATDAKYAYALSNSYASQTAKGYEYSMVVNGEKVTLTTEAVESGMQIGNIYTYTEDKDGVATLAIVASGDTAAGVITSVSGKYITLKGGAVVELASAYTVDDLTATDADGAIVPGIGDLTADSKIVYITSADKLVKAYIINDGKAATFELGNANKGALVATDGYTISMSGTLAKAVAGNIQEGSAEGHYIAYKFTAPAGVSATSGNVKIATSTNGTTFGELQNYGSFDGFANGATSVKVVAGPMSVTDTAFNTKAVKVEITWNADYVETYIINVSDMKPAAS